ncbi:MAG: hypothetical protein ACM31D_08280 [Bacteroidota bacterium]
MSDLLIAQDPEAELQPGQIRFYQAAMPPLSAGQYQLVATQTVSGLNDGNPAPQYSTTLPFTVDAPRFRLPADAVQMSYPPANATGAFDNALPNIVLRNRTLPWCRTIDGLAPVPDQASTPWMALLTVTASELGIADTVETPAPTVTATVANLVDPPQGTMGPTLANVSADTKTEPVLLLTMDIGLFQKVVPSLTDLPYLSHVREINTDHKEILGLDENGFFSVVVGNRLMQASAVNYHFLVSLEGYSDFIRTGANPNNCPQICLAVLAWWRVTANQSLGNFIDIMQSLPNNGGVGLLQAAYEPFTGADVCPPSGPTNPVQVAAQALALGYTPLENTMRIGEHATAWYRGPASPVPLNQDGLGPYLRSDAAMRYDPSTGIYDMSYAAAWEIGRLLALSSNAMAQSLYLWRQKSAQQMLQNARDEALAEKLATVSRDLPVGQAALTDSGVAGVHQALAAVLSEVAGRAVENVPQRVSRTHAPPQALAPGLCSTEERAACEADADPIARLFATVLAK